MSASTQPSSLDAVIQGALDPTIAVRSLLPLLRDAAEGAGDTETATWARAEADGYEPDAALPAYRSAGSVATEGAWGHRDGDESVGPIEPGALSGDIGPLVALHLRQPVRVLEQLLRDDSPRTEWDVAPVMAYMQAGNTPPMRSNPLAALNSVRHVRIEAEIAAALNGVRGELHRRAIALRAAER